MRQDFDHHHRKLQPKLSKLAGYLFVSFGALLMGVADIIIKRLLDTEIDIVDLVAMRDIFGFFFLFLGAILFAPDTLKIAGRDIIFLFSYGIIGIAMLHLFGIWSVKVNSVSMGIILLYTSPLFILLWSAASRIERLYRYEIIAAALVLAGIVLAFQAYDTQKFRAYRFGLFVGICSAIIFAFSTIWGKRGVQRLRPLTVSVYGMGAAAAFWLLTGSPIRFLAAKHDLSTWSALFLVAILGSLFMPVFYLIGLRSISAAEANLTASLEQVFAMGLSYAVLQERFAIIQFGGLGMIVAGVAYLQIRGFKRIN